ncbi:MAG TPA: NRDE family protein [Vicinamibacterales bacterium]|nr:NRDE family protein [Vicinamibacterales bacterium]
MCTISVIRPAWSADDSAPRLRVVCNRDERRSRAEGTDPVVTSDRATRALMPIDPVGGGTWIAATDAGLVFALLNGDERLGRGETAGDCGCSPNGVRSRGLIIPSLLRCRSTEAVRDLLMNGDWKDYRPWRLMVYSSTQVLDAEPAWRGVRYLVSPLPSRHVTSSSSLDAIRAIRLRTELFARLVDRPEPRLQDAFHRHRWPVSPGVSVLMDRPDSRTVSRTVVEVFDDHLRMSYESLVGARRPARSATLELTLTAGAA